MVTIGSEWARARRSAIGAVCPPLRPSRERSRVAWWRRLGVLLVVLPAACGNKVAPTAVVEPAPAEQKASRRIQIAADVLRDAGIEVATVGKEALSPSLALPGEVAAIPDRSARLSTPLAGRLELVQFNEGSLVKKGERLAVVRVPDLGKVRGSFTSSTAKAKAARSFAARAKRLQAEALASEQDVIDAEAQAQAVEAEARALGEQIGALGMGASGGSPFDLALPAPVTGLVTHRDAVVGQPVSADQSLAEITNLEVVWFIAHVYEKDLGRLRKDAPAEVELNAYPGETFAGTVSFVGAQVDPVSRTIMARIQLVNTGDRLRLGLFGTARIVSSGEGARPEMPVVPRAALTEIDGKTVVFVRVGEGVFEPRNVLVGDAAPGKVAITAGLQGGEIIAIHGVFTLKSIALKATLAEDP